MKRGGKWAVPVVCAAALMAMPVGDGGWTVEGRWRAEVEVAEEVNAALAEAGLGEYLAVTTLPVAVEFVFREDGTYSCAADEAAFAAAVEQVKEELAAGIWSYTEDLVDSGGGAMEAQEVFDAMGVSLTELLDAAFSMENLTGLQAGEEAGRYALRNGRLYFSKSVDAPPDESAWDEVRPEGDKMTFTAAVGAPNAAFGQGQYPIEFHRVEP